MSLCGLLHKKTAYLHGNYSLEPRGSQFYYLLYLLLTQRPNLEALGPRVLSAVGLCSLQSALASEQDRQSCWVSEDLDLRGDTVEDFNREPEVQQQNQEPFAF